MSGIRVLNADTKRVFVENYPDLEEINLGAVTTYLYIKACTKITRINHGTIRFRGVDLAFDPVPLLKNAREINLVRCHKVERIPNLVFLESLEVDDCRGLKSIDVRHKVDLLVSNCPLLTSVPRWSWGLKTLSFNNRWLIVRKSRLALVIKAQAYFRMYLIRKKYLMDKMLYQSMYKDVIGIVHQY